MPIHLPNNLLRARIIPIKMKAAALRHILDASRSIAHRNPNCIRLLLAVDMWLLTVVMHVLAPDIASDLLVVRLALLGNAALGSICKVVVVGNRSWRGYHV